jgi:hypothetical protein
MTGIAYCSYSLVYVLCTARCTQVAHIKGAQARKFLSTMEKKAAVPFSTIFPEAQPEALAMLHSLLVFDPQQRATAAQSLLSPYLTPFQDEPFEPPAPPAQLSFEFERSGALWLRTTAAL